MTSKAPFTVAHLRSDTLLQHHGIAQTAQHSRYIRDYLAPLLASEPTIPTAELALLSSILTRLGAVPMTLELLRYSRIEKALHVVAFTAGECWPAELVLRAELILKKWEAELGPGVKNVQQDFFSPGGRLEGMTSHELAMGERDFDDVETLRWAPDTVETLGSFEMAHTGFKVGEWYLNPSAAYLAGIITNPTIPISSHPEAPPNSAFALLLSASAEELLPPFDGTHIRYHHPPHSPNAVSLCRTFALVTPKPIRVLRSWKLQSPFAPKAGVRYDGLYNVKGYRLKLTPPNEWAYSFTLERVVNEQSPLSTILSVPTSDQLDDWKDYLKMLVANHGAAAAGSAIEAPGSGQMMPRTRTGSLESEYASSGVSSVDSHAALFPETIAEQNGAVVDSASLVAAMEEHGVMETSQSSRSFIDHEALNGMAGKRRGKNDGGRIHVGGQAGAPASVSDVIVGGEMAGVGRSPLLGKGGSDMSEYLGFKRKWGI